ncbi:hypothetical protein FGO68_gene7855 [Halteria grandinella]|uniref:Uncharacterized protein n=1 Tax=Halteria grandinella TaxID=5974 RepID=A0A8J8P1S6_HALGN|nr:hypothetical protein FGO68_gene7855 [Halteria grandinella]
MGSPSSVSPFQDLALGFWMIQTSIILHLQQSLKSVIKIAAHCKTGQIIITDGGDRFILQSKQIWTEILVFDNEILKGLL